MQTNYDNLIRFLLITDKIGEYINIIRKIQIHKGGIMYESVSS